MRALSRILSHYLKLISIDAKEINKTVNLMLLDYECAPYKKFMYDPGTFIAVNTKMTNDEFVSKRFVKQV